MVKMVQLSDDAYRRLKARKRAGESFSDVVVRITGGRGSLLDLGGLRSKAEIAKAAKDLKRIDALDRADAERLA